MLVHMQTIQLLILQRRMKKKFSCNDLHFKIALTGCPNDCIKARMHDFGIIGV